MSDWASCYVPVPRGPVGSSGAAPIGMQFVVMTVIASRDERPTTDALKAFATPTAVILQRYLHRGSRYL